MQNKNEMNLDQAMTFVIKDEVFDGENRKLFTNKDAADTFSESLKEQWKDGKGMVYGPFVSGSKKWYEVSFL